MIKVPLLLQKEIAENREFSLVSPVELRLPSNGTGLTRSAGRGVCTLSRKGLQYCGTKDGETVQEAKERLKKNK